MAYYNENVDMKNIAERQLWKTSIFRKYLIKNLIVQKYQRIT